MILIRSRNSFTFKKENLFEEKNKEYEN